MLDKVVWHTNTLWEWESTFYMCRKLKFNTQGDNETIITGCKPRQHTGIKQKKNKWLIYSAHAKQAVGHTLYYGSMRSSASIYTHNYNNEITFSSSSVKSSPLEDLLMAWATPMISPSLLRMGMHKSDLVLYPVSLSISSLNRRSCNP